MVRPILCAAAFCGLLATSAVRSQPEGAPAPPTPYQRVLSGLKARCIGPANTGGRVTDVAVVESSPDTFYVASAGGGVWKTTDGGETFNPVFDAQPTQCIGAVAVCQAKPEVVYVGTGEGNPRNSVSWGKGVYRSADGGKTWKACGLENTHHIGRVVAHPTDPDTAYVAAVGHFWGPNPERGLFKTTDGGKTWAHSLKIDDDTGVVDVALDPADPNTLYAAAWGVRRDGFSGPNPAKQTNAKGGLFKSQDAGKTWDKMAGGLPERGYGRCGVAVSKKDPNIVYAVVQTDKTKAVTNIGQVAEPGGPADNGGVFRSADRGKTWEVVNQLVPRPFYYGQVRVDPEDPERVYVLGVSFHYSTDGGKHMKTAPTAGVHSDMHALWVNPKDPKHMILGTDGGLYVSKDQGKNWAMRRGMVISQFYGVAVDSRTPYRVYGGLQDNGTWGAPVSTPFADGVTVADWKRIGGTADGFQVAVDRDDPDVIYHEILFGGLNRTNLKAQKGDQTKKIRPGPPTNQPTPGQPQQPAAPNRFNWNAPFILSPHDTKVLYFGSQYVWRSSNRGDTWTKQSPDLSRVKGAAANGRTILTLAESPVKGLVLWAGTDDGNIWVSNQTRNKWAEVGQNLEDVPNDRAISKIECDHKEPGTAYVAIDRHRNDDTKPYIFKTTDFGETWEPMVKGLPAGAVVGVVRQSSKNPKVLFAGTEMGLYVTPDGGKNWHHLKNTGLPPGVRVDDLVIHPRERELVIGTHGRGVWVMDIAPLEQLSEEVLAAPAHLFDVKPSVAVKQVPRPAPAKGAELLGKAFAAANPPAGVPVAFYLGKGAAKAEVTLTDKAGKTIASKAFDGLAPGLYGAALPAPPGEYTVTLKAAGATKTRTAVVTKEGEMPADDQ
ncbi:VPS10 domain-containing protein [Urbifossiella limnaea]|uniref:BNR/Asp-box repeat protein n=1 Tax=Urbifossiella limnaea TaxID=2528023 RepID=A0A517XTG1_9BACT|nr:hypothetical protein [Urbifossiella limnaea]QDU20777.1 BNR/Asp-box repeat protein [Urbifossiella limnaea]